MKKIFLLAIIIISVIKSNAQQGLTLYNMDILGQSSQVNPSLIPANRMYIGIPMLSSTNFMFTNSGFTWRDIHKVRDDDSTEIDINNAIDKLAEKNFISLSIKTN